MIPDILTSTSTTKSGKEATHLAWWVTLLMSMSLAIGTWNPTGHCFIDYIFSVEDPFSGFRPFAILIMVALWILAGKAIYQGLGYLGMSIALIVIGSFIWGLDQYGFIDIHNPDQLGWPFTISKGLLIWLGLISPIIWKKLTGVYTTDATSEDI